MYQAEILKVDTKICCTSFSSAETNIESQPMVDTHSKRTLLIKTVETRDGQVGGNFDFVSITT